MSLDLPEYVLHWKVRKRSEGPLRRYSVKAWEWGTIPTR